MVETGEGDPDYADRIHASAAATREAWQATLDDMDELAAELEADGWTTAVVPASHTAPEGPDAGDTDRFGLVFLVPDNFGRDFSELFESGKFPEYEVYRADVENDVFLLLVLRDPDTKSAILVAGSYELRHAPNCVAAARDADTMYTHFETLDDTHLGSFEHDDWEKFFPDHAGNWIENE